MANGSSSASPSTDTFLIFVDTSLDTHFVIGVSSEDTVADLNGKLRACHSVCFPYIGDITIQSLKVRRRGCFYHLTDMHVKSVFDGIRGSWVLYVDAISACYQAGTTGNAVICDGEQQQKDRLLDPEPNSSTLCLGADAVQDFGMNGSLTGKDLIPLDTDVENEMQTFPNARPEMLSLHNDISVLHVGTNNVDLAPNGANGNSSGDVLKLHEPVVGDMPGHHGTNKVVDEGKEDACEADRGNIGDEATVGLVHDTKEKSKKRSSSFRNDPLLEKVDSCMEKKKHKKKKDGSSEVHTGDPLVELGRCKPGKMLSIARDDFSLKDQTSGKKRKKKREKKEERGSELADGTVQVNKEVPRDKKSVLGKTATPETLPDNSMGKVVAENTGVLLGDPNDHIELPNINIESVIPEAGQLEPPTSMVTESGVGSAVFSKTNDGTNGITPTQPSSEVKKGSPFSMILRSTSRYKKAKAMATASKSQAQLEDGESQPIDVSP